MGHGGSSETLRSGKLQAAAPTIFTSMLESESSKGVAKPQHGSAKFVMERTLICTHLRSFALICAHLHSFALICIHLHSFAFICTHLRSFALICTHLRSFAFICAHFPTGRRLTWPPALSLHENASLVTVSLVVALVVGRWSLCRWSLVVVVR